MRYYTNNYLKFIHIEFINFTDDLFNILKYIVFYNLNFQLRSITNK